VCTQVLVVYRIRAGLYSKLKHKELHSYNTVDEKGLEIQS